VRADRKSIASHEDRRLNCEAALRRIAVLGLGARANALASLGFSATMAAVGPDAT